MAHRSEAELLAERDLILAAQGDRAAFAPLYERYVDQIFAYALTLTQNREHAEDVTAATFARAVEELPRFEWRGVPYSAWLYRVAANLVARDRRRPGWIGGDPGRPRRRGARRGGPAPGRPAPGGAPALRWRAAQPGDRGDHGTERGGGEAAHLPGADHAPPPAGGAAPGPAHLTSQRGGRR
ncbi:MAG: hypothetical protein E6I76_13385 [Chloroflexi bacterium]|nr:MAG: hypothetical protein E6I76_13385 [Chloroflexota bacterium]